MKSVARELPEHLKTWGHIFSSTTETRFRWKRPHHYQDPNFRYASAAIFRHRDYAGRVREEPQGDRYLHALDGNLRKLIVQCTDGLFTAPGTTTWRRTYVRRVSPLTVRVATWVIDYKDKPEGPADYAVLLGRTVVASVAMFFTVSPANSSGVLNFSRRLRLQ